MSHRVVMPHCHIRTLAQVHHDYWVEEAGGWRRGREGHHGAVECSCAALCSGQAGAVQLSVEVVKTLSYIHQGRGGDGGSSHQGHTPGSRPYSW